MPLFQSGGTFSIDGVGSDTWKMFLRNWEMQHQATAKQNNLDIPGLVGRYAQKMELSSRLITLDISCYEPTRSSFLQRLNDFSAATDPRNGAHKLILTDDFPNRWIGITPSSFGQGSTNIIPVQAPLGYSAFAALYECPDPHWYNTVPTNIAWSPTTSGQTQNWSNNGNDSTPATLHIAYTGATNRGALTGIQLKFQSTYFLSTWTYQGSLTVGDFIDVNFDPTNLSLTKNNVNDMTNWAGDDFPLIPGTTTGLPKFTPPVAAPVVTTMTWSDTNNVGATITGSFVERWV